MKYKIRFEGWGAEIVIGSATEKMYNHFKENDIDVSDHLFATMEDELSADIHGGLTMDTKYENDKYYHNSGAYLNDAVWLTVTDENEKEVYSAIVTEGQHLIECSNEIGLHDFEDDYVIMGDECCKGLLAEYELEIDEEFDPELMVVLYDEIDEDIDLIVELEYDGDPLVNTGEVSSTGKGGQWFIQNNNDGSRTTY